VLLAGTPGASQAPDGTMDMTALILTTSKTKTVTTAAAAAA
jgi:hypothetical protein